MDYLTTTAASRDVFFQPGDNLKIAKRGEICSNAGVDLLYARFWTLSDLGLTPHRLPCLRPCRAVAAGRVSIPVR